ncbi:MAG: hypothetical protein DYG89_48005 [Caldilinea sp. CFX5]|nr:hypothetical protein [Caldilinea sp. CFX5]
MKFLADECTDVQLVEVLRTHGFDVLYVMETMRGAKGVILLRFNPGEETQKATRLYQLLQNSTITLVGAFIVIESDRIRTRPLIS